VWNIVVEGKQLPSVHFDHLSIDVDVYLAGECLNGKTPCRLMFVKTTSGFKRDQDDPKIGVLYDRVGGVLRLPWLLRLKPANFLSYIKTE
jgi:hypothetical protein